jgi:hypothetical protein
MATVYQESGDAINIYRVVPANAGIHTPRPIDQKMELIASVQQPPVVMGPGVRRDDAESVLCAPEHCPSRAECAK